MGLPHSPGASCCHASRHPKRDALLAQSHHAPKLKGIYSMPETKCLYCHAGYSKTYDALAKHVQSLVWDSAVESNPEYAQITEFLCGRSGDRAFGHDSIDAYRAVLKIGDMAGLPPGWSTCAHCNGDG
jgi:hypothetical protein